MKFNDNDCRREDMSESEIKIMTGKVLPENILRCMSPEARSPLVKSGKTSEEAIAKYEYGQERRLHQQIKQLLDIRGLVYVNSRTDKRTTTAKGVPDFIIFQRDKPELCIEVKVGNNQLSGDQIKWMSNYLKSTGRGVFLVRSLEELKALL